MHYRLVNIIICAVNLSFLVYFYQTAKYSGKFDSQLLLRMASDRLHSAFYLLVVHMTSLVVSLNCSNTYEYVW